MGSGLGAATIWVTTFSTTFTSRVASMRIASARPATTNCTKATIPMIQHEMRKVSV